jgi:hypothetical protein
MLLNRLKTTLLLSLLTVLMVLMGSALGGKTGMVFAFLPTAGRRRLAHPLLDPPADGGAHRPTGVTRPTGGGDLIPPPEKETA